MKIVDRSRHEWIGGFTTPVRVAVIDGGFEGGIRGYDSAHRDGIRVMEPEGYAKSFGPELADFAGAVLEGRQLQAGPREALGELRTVLAIYRSAASGRWEKVFE